MGSNIGSPYEFHAASISEIKASKGILHRITINDKGSSTWTLSVFDEASANNLFEYFSATAAASANVYDTTWQTQTFTIGTLGSNVKQYVNRISILAYRVGSPGDVTISIKAVDAAHKPTGSALATSTVSANAWTEVVTGLWYDFDMVIPYELAASTEYAIEVKATTGDSSNKIVWLKKATSGYAGGLDGASTDSGSTWTMGSGDFTFKQSGFREYLKLIPTVTGTMELRCNFSRGLGIAPLAGTAGSLTVVYE